MAEEIEANQFAAEVLMPSEILLDRIAYLSLEYAPIGDSTEEAIDELAAEFKVSKQALQIRLADFI